ncbi:hypothetical protein [Halobacillus sp. Marseille-Q1614]|uniref:hypothetical protein n=1 Tax=Halobacillus sp. Marseille-Q1614 TaxID=2709134 RepID=UPI0015710898|nr:hypothetical protein [Halobacillus sp. Marseille-Q1614]
MKIVRFFVYYILGAAGIFIISLAPALFSGGAFFNLKAFISEGKLLIESLADPSQWVYETLRQTEPLIPYLWDLYLYSMTIFVGAMAIAVIAALLLAFGTFLLLVMIKRPLKKVLGLLEAFPDLLLAFCLQLFSFGFLNKQKFC